ncbi:mercuric reductase [Flavobacterium sp. SLB02]|uniref:mercuric reductase n=1 Tax=Flavobacterium sp. SLB02 TaxID=2665645 RepID=UPI0012A8AFCE|nr:mercuric reductase [Flavobacterium sp. SLB02]QGK75240.1 pyruvate/2-oxoglutarate dehydrogenase complex dihydrolipoamide dehydrogenase [Flavobacterium sp. SLB02]
MKKFDYIIIGSGQAGIPLAFSLSKEGTVAIIEKSFLGGTCVNNGCIPTKAYVASARRVWDAFHGDDLGVEIPKGTKANLKKIKARKDELVNESRSNIEKAINRDEKITLYHGEAHFLSNYQVKVADTILTAKKIFINVGARAVVPEEYQQVPFYTNENILEITEIPKHLIIIGGSYIGLEFAQIFRRFGSEVTIIERNKELINREDQTVTDVVAQIMKAEGVDLVFNAKDISVKENKKQSIILKTDTAEINGTHLLLAIGRAPNTDTLQLENTTIKLDDKKYIKVNNYCQTNVQGVFAIGDCNGQGAFTHTAYNDFQIVKSFLLKKKKRKISERITTYGLFIDPPLGRIGMTKKEALEKGYEILVGYRPMTKVNRAKEKAETLGFMEAVIDAKTNLFLGACVFGVGGDEIINGITNLMYAKKPYTVLRDSVHIHPTVSELIPTMLEDLKPIAK